MNVFLQKQILFPLLLLLAVPLVGTAQYVVQENIYETQVYVDTFTSSPNDPALLQPPSHGTLVWGEIADFTYELTYTPDSAFTGTDVFKFYIWEDNNVPTFTQLTYEITVLPSLVTAEHDHLTTSYEQPLTIDVTANDYSSTGVLNLKTIPSVNNGTAVFTPDGEQIVFTPSADFSGVAYLNYVVCDDIGSCDDGTVVVNVLEQVPSQTDTMRVFTTKNQPQPIFVPNDYILTQSPDNGSYDESGDMPIYTPDTDFLGEDYIGYDYMGMDRVVEVIVLDVVPNQFAFDDEEHMTPYEGQIEINVLANDEFGMNTSCIGIGANAEHGTVVYDPQTDGKGIFRYTPAAGFTGVDWFTYTSCPPMSSGSAETATVFIYVSNYEPAEATFAMSTPKLTPLVIGYSVPIVEFDFEVVEGGDLGTTEFLEGNVDTTIFGQQVTGYNLIIYIPDGNVDAGMDEVELEYCVMTNDTCNYLQTVKIDIEILDIGDGTGPMCFDDCIWPGDANFDGVVDMQDLLAIGLSMGEVGKPRSNVDLTQWYGQYGEDWNNPFQPLPIDLKHPDTDGDSLITAMDTVAISNFYGKAHSMTSAVAPFYEDEIVLEGDLYADPGDLVEMNMILGTPQDPAEDIYGFTFPFNYNPDVVDSSTVSIEYGTNSWLSYNSPVLNMQRNDFAGLLESGFTRTNQISATGHGEIGTLRFIISEDVDGFRDDDGEIIFSVGGGTSTVMNSAGQSYGMRIGSANIRIRLKPAEEAEDQPLSNDQLKVYPNPTQQNFINVHLNGRRDFERVRVFDMTGRMMYDSDQILGNHLQVPTGNLHNGMYILSVLTPDGLLTKKFEVLR